MDLKKCDLCGLIIGSQDSYRLKYFDPDESFCSEKELDLCENCMNSFISWSKEFKRSSQEPKPSSVRRSPYNLKDKLMRW